MPSPNSFMTSPSINGIINNPMTPDIPFMSKQITSKPIITIGNNSTDNDTITNSLQTTSILSNITHPRTTSREKQKNHTTVKELKTATINTPTANTKIIYTHIPIIQQLLTHSTLQITAIPHATLLTSPKTIATKTITGAINLTPTVCTTFSLLFILRNCKSTRPTVAKTISYKLQAQTTKTRKLSPTMTITGIRPTKEQTTNQFTSRRPIYLVSKITNTFKKTDRVYKQDTKLQPMISRNLPTTTATILPLTIATKKFKMHTTKTTSSVVTSHSMQVDTNNYSKTTQFDRTIRENETSLSVPFPTTVKNVASSSELSIQEITVITLCCVISVFVAILLLIFYYCHIRKHHKRMEKDSGLTSVELSLHQLNIRYFNEKFNSTQSSLTEIDLNTKLPLNRRYNSFKKTNHDIIQVQQKTYPNQPLVQNPNRQDFLKLKLAATDEMYHPLNSRYFIVDDKVKV